MDGFNSSAFKILTTNSLKILKFYPKGRLKRWKELSQKEKDFFRGQAVNINLESNLK